MRKRFVGYVFLTLLVLNLFLVLVKIQPVLAASTITILSNGSIQPSDAPIQRNGSLYTLTENITFNNPGFASAIRIERSNMTFDGNGFALKNASDLCIDIYYATNVTIRNTTLIDSVSIGMRFYKCSNCTVIQNSVLNCGPDTARGAIDISDSKGFKVAQNTITGPRSVAIMTLVAHAYDYHNISNNRIYNVDTGISLESHDSIVQGNTIRNASGTGISLRFAQDTLILNNSISDCNIGIDLGFESQSDTVSGNTINSSRHSGIRTSAQYTTITENNVTNTLGTLGYGIYASARFSVVSRNNVINSTNYGIRVGGDGNSVTDNYVANSGDYGIFVSGDPNSNYSDCHVSRNFVTNAKIDGISVSCNYTVVSENTAVNNSLYGISLSRMYHSEIFDNRILNNPRGLRIYYFGNNSIYHNHFTNNTQQVYLSNVLANNWDDGYPSGGNYWSNYTGVDIYKGPNQDVLGSDGIGDTSHVIATDNVDRYPRVSEPSPGALVISPSYGGNTGNVTVRVTGAGFTQGMVAKLARAGLTNITGSQTTIVNSTFLTTTFNLAGIEPDTTWDLIITYGNGTELKLEYAFKVMLGGEPIIYADITGRHQLRIAHSSIYSVRIYNKGNVDTTDQLITLHTDPALKILNVKDPTGKTVWNRTALQQTITNGQLQHPELWQGDSSQMVSEFLNKVVLYAPLIRAGDCLTLQVEVYAKIPWNGDDPLVLIVAKQALEYALTHILSQIISSELIFYGVDKQIAQQLRTASYPVTGSMEFTQILVEYLLEEFGSSVGAGVGAFGKWGVGALTGLGLALETGKKVGEHSKPEASVEKPVQPVSSYDPNDKAGPTGYGTAVYVPADANLTYIVYFENLANATAEAENILITDTLDADLDWSTLSIGSSSHPDTMNYSFNSTTGTITWVFAGINLPPNKAPPEGEGWVSYSVKAKAGLATGAEIRNKATIVFDINPPIDTPEILHTIDSSPPESAIQSLPAQSNTSFTLSWSGTDAGSGVKAYSIYYSDNDGPWVVWLLQTPETTATFNGQVGHTYKFYSRAIDQVGNHEETPQNPDATTTAIADNTPPETQLSVGSPRYVDLAETEYVTSATPFSLSATDNEGGSSGVASTTYRVHNSTYDSGWQTYSSSFYLSGLKDGNYSLEYRSTDRNTNTETPKETNVVLDNNAPEASVVIDNGAAYTGSTAVMLQLIATDVLQNTIEVRFSNDNAAFSDWEAYAPAKTWNLTSGSGMKTCYVQFKDFLGLTSTRSDTIGLDTSPPQGSITINNGATYTNSTSVTLSLSGVDPVSGVAQMRFSNDNVTWSEWEVYATSRLWTLTSDDGVKTVYCQLKDNVGLVSNSYSVTIILDATKPVANAGTDQTVNVGSAVSFDADQSSDNVGVVSYEWDFGDGATAQGQTATHTYASAGAYTATLTVMDAAGNMATDTVNITVLSTEAFPMWIAGVAAATIAIAAAAILLLRKRK